MSKTKQALDENFSVLTGVEFDGAPEQDEIPQEYMLMASIGSDIRHLLHHKMQKHYVAMQNS